LASEVAKRYGCVDFLRFPNVDAPKIEEWLACAKKELETLQPDVVVCHSLANTLWFHLCNEAMIKREVEKLFLVAPPSLQCSIEELESFFPIKAPEKLCARSAMLVVSDNDPYMEIEEALWLKSHLGIEMHILKNAGHINAESGYGEWPWMLEKIVGEACTIQ
jgi:predicted alpha/beta hydrolase family esterase